MPSNSHGTSLKVISHEETWQLIYYVTYLKFWKDFSDSPESKIRLLGLTLRDLVLGWDLGPGLVNNGIESLQWYTFLTMEVHTLLKLRYGGKWF